jgi:hypothetical protein
MEGSGSIQIITDSDQYLGVPNTYGTYGSAALTSRYKKNFWGIYNKINTGKKLPEGVFPPFLGQELHLMLQQLHLRLQTLPEFTENLLKGLGHEKEFNFFYNNE